MLLLEGLGTIIINEAGQVNMPSSIPILLLKFKRITVIGDHKQLQPQVSSYAADEAGHGKSCMEWIELT